MAVLALGLRLAGPAFSQEIPSGEVWTHREQNNWVHIYKNPSYDKTEPAKRSVLVLGLYSDADVVKTQCKYVNPATGKPYDVVIGLAAPGALTEAERVIWTDHIDAKENAGAVGAAIAKAFGGKIQAGTLDMHSNGNAVGIAMLEKNIGFAGVKKLNMMAPDEGLGARNLDPDRLSAIVARQGIGAIEVYINSGDVVPKGGALSRKVADTVVFENVSAKGVPLRVHEFDYQVPLSLEDHYLAAYLVLRALESGNPEVIQNMRESVTEDLFQWVVGIVTPTGNFGRQVAKRIEELKMKEDIPLAAIKETERNLEEIQGYQASLSSPGEESLADVAKKLAGNDRKTLGELHARVALIERALACLAQITEKPAEVPNETFHPPPQPPPQAR